MKLKLLVLSLIFSAASGFASTGTQPPGQQVREQIQAQRAQVNSACAADAASAGCPGQEVGEGLLKCLHSYKKQNKKEFVLSEGCKEAMKSLRAARKERKNR
jgi:hypothetical protein